MSMLAFAAALGKEVEQKFRTLNYCEREFADLATATLLDHDAGMTFTPEDVLEAGLNHELPWQADVDSVFGEPAITLYAHPRFRLDALCWRNGTTSIHQHQFTGAFAVAWGSSLQS